MSGDQTQLVKYHKLTFNYPQLGEFLRFEPVTLVPFEPKLIDYGLMSPAQIQWLNSYNELIREKICPLLKVTILRIAHYNVCSYIKISCLCVLTYVISIYWLSKVSAYELVNEYL